MTLWSPGSWRGRRPTTKGRRRLLLLPWPNRVPLLVGPVEHGRRVGPAAARLQHLAAIDHDGIAVDVGRPVAHQIGREIGQLYVLPNPAHRDRLDHFLLAAALLGHQPAPGAFGWEGTGD